MIDNNCVYPSLHNNSYADSVRADNGLYYNYTSVFKEYTTQEAGVACNSYANCYIGCSCKTGWNKRSASASSVSDVSNLQTSGVKTASASSLSGNVSTMAAGDSCTVNITDPRYGTKCSISSTRDCAGVCDGSAYFRCTSGSTSSSCPSGQYSVNVGKQQCSSGSATNSTSCYSCYNCTYSCSSGYSTSTTSCSTGYYLDTETASKADSSCPSKTCGKCKSCNYSCSAGYSTSTTSCGTGYTLKTETASKASSSCPSKTCGKCEQTCTPKDCSGYNLTISDMIDVGHYEGCNVINDNCEFVVSKYKLVGCDSGYTLQNNTCVKNTSTTGPCTGTCNFNSTVPYPVRINGMNCCCPTSGETNSLKCDCCLKD